VRGAVRDVAKLRAAAFYQKAFVAALAARAEQDFELALLRVRAGHQAPRTASDAPPARLPGTQPC
jgi:hypothetical protein